MPNTPSTSLTAVCRALFAALVLLHLAGCDNHGETRAEIRQVWASIDAAYDSRDPRAITSRITAGSWPYYERIRAAAVSATRDEIARMPAMERSIVLAARHRATAADLRNLDGRGFLQLAVRDGWFDFDEPAWLELGSMVIEGNRARARVITHDETTDYWFHFIREDDAGQPGPHGVWKLDDPACDAMWNDLFKLSAQFEGMTVDELIFMEQEEHSGRPIRSDIWDRPTEPRDLASPAG